MSSTVKTLSARERRFVTAYVGKAAGNATLAASLAGYSKKTSGQIGYRLLKKVHIQQAIAKRADPAERSDIADAAERDAILSSILRSPTSSEQGRIKAIAELNKCAGRHITKLEHSGALTLEQVLDVSRASA